MKKPQIKFQIGKNGLTDGFIECLKKAFNSRNRVKISVLKSGGHEKENVREIAEKIQEGLGKNYVYKIVGFTISLIKLKK